MQKQLFMAPSRKEPIYIQSINEPLESSKEILQRLFSMRSFTEQEIVNLVLFLEVELHEGNRPEVNFWMESLDLWSLPPELSKSTGDVGISLVLTDGVSTSVVNTLL